MRTTINDKKNLTAEYKVTNGVDCTKQLDEILSEINEILEVDSLDALADKDYYNP